MADYGSDVLNMINATPQEQAALQQIAQARAANPGIPDAQLYQMMGYTQGGGYGYLDAANQAAQTAASYNINRGNLALDAYKQYQDTFSSPYNVVAAEQYMRDNPNASALGGGMQLGNVQSSPASAYLGYVNGLLSPTGQTGGAGGAGGAGMSAQPNPTGQSWIDAWRAYHPGQADPVGGYATSGVNTGAQQAAAQRYGASLGGVGIGAPAMNVLKSGGVLGNSAINERTFGLMSPEQQAAYFGLQGSTGRMKNPADTYKAYTDVYAQR